MQKNILKIFILIIFVYLTFLSSSFSQADEYTFCANHNQTCNISGKKDVEYGALGKFNYQYGVENNIFCSNTVFGDPYPGVNKACYTKNAEDRSNEQYTLCAIHNEECIFSGKKDVKYGALGKFTYILGVENSIFCSNTIFGDPYPGVDKACYIPLENSNSNNSPNISVFTDSADTITDTSAILRGHGTTVNVYPPGCTSFTGYSATTGQPCDEGVGISVSLPKTAYFRYSKSSIPPIFCNDIYGSNIISTGDISIGNLETSSAFYQEINNLSPNTTYYYCAVVSDKNNIVYGTDNIVKQFHTNPLKTTVQTNPATYITSTSARLNGTYSSTKTVNTYFKYKEDTTSSTSFNNIKDYIIKTLVKTANAFFGEIPASWIQIGDQTHSIGSYNNLYGNISYSLTGLKPLTKYVFLATAESGSGTDFEIVNGSTLSFTTKAGSAVSGESGNDDETISGCNEEICGISTTGGGVEDIIVNDGEEIIIGNGGGGIIIGGGGGGIGSEGGGIIIGGGGIGEIGGSGGTWTTETGNGTWTTTTGTGGVGISVWTETGNGTGVWTSETGSGTWTTTTGTSGGGGGSWGDGTAGSGDQNDGIWQVDPNLPLYTLGQIVTPPSDAIVRYHEGIETVFTRQIIADVPFAKLYGYQEGTDLVAFAWDLSDQLARMFGYVDENGLEIRVSFPDIAAYQLSYYQNKLTVYEYYDERIIDIRNITTEFKNASYYEYNYKK